MSYGSVRQYRNRVTRAFNAGEQSPMSVSCQNCVGDLPCAACKEVLDNEWLPATDAFFPVALQGMTPDSTDDLKRLVR